MGSFVFLFVVVLPFFGFVSTFSISTSGLTLFRLLLVDGILWLFQLCSCDSVWPIQQPWHWHKPFLLTYSNIQIWLKIHLIKPMVGFRRFAGFSLQSWRERLNASVIIRLTLILCFNIRGVLILLVLKSLDMIKRTIYITFYNFFKFIYVFINMIIC